MADLGGGPVIALIVLAALAVLGIGWWTAVRVLKIAPPPAARFRPKDLLGLLGLIAAAGVVVFALALAFHAATGHWPAHSFYP